VVGGKGRTYGGQIEDIPSSPIFLLLLNSSFQGQSPAQNQEPRGAGGVYGQPGGELRAGETF
jgi:hypothetical protein